MKEIVEAQAHISLGDGCLSAGNVLVTVKRKKKFRLRALKLLTTGKPLSPVIVP